MSIVPYELVSRSTLVPVFIEMSPGNKDLDILSEESLQDKMPFRHLPLFKSVK